MLVSTGTGWSSTSISAGLAPAGTIMTFAGTTAPTGYLICPQSPTNISRTTYAALFAAVGTTWGTGDGSTTFGIPYFAQGFALLQNNGNVGAQTTGAVIAHSHSITPIIGQGGSGNSSGGFTGGVSVINITSTNSFGQANNYAAGGYVVFCVKY